MITYIIRRTLAMIPVLIGINALTLILFYVVSADPVLQHAGRNPSEETLQALRDKFELNAPLFYSSDYLTGEDILKARRADRLRIILSEVQKQIADGTIENTQSAQNIVDYWRTHQPNANDQSTINKQLNQLGLINPPQIQFTDITLSDSDNRKISKRHWYDAQFFRVLRFDFAHSMVYQDQNIWDLFRVKLPVTLKITLPMLFVGLAFELTLALFAARHRRKATDTIITILAVFAMSIPFLSYIVFGQWFAAESRWFPVSGYDTGLKGVHFLVFPVAIGIIAGLGSGIRFNRAVLLEEMDRDYVRTARAKGVKETDILFIHVLRNGGIPILTRLSIVIPFLITGSLLIERNFELPGLGDLMLSAITARDFWVVMPLTYILAIVYAGAVLITDILYAVVDPRVRVH